MQMPHKHGYWIIGWDSFSPIFISCFKQILLTVLWTCKDFVYVETHWFHTVSPVENIYWPKESCRWVPSRFCPYFLRAVKWNLSFESGLKKQLLCWSALHALAQPLVLVGHLSALCAKAECWGMQLGLPAVHRGTGAGEGGWGALWMAADQNLFCKLGAEHDC